MTERRERILGTLAELLREIWPEHPRRALHPATALTDLGLSTGLAAWALAGEGAARRLIRRKRCAIAP